MGLRKESESDLRLDTRWEMLWAHWSVTLTALATLWGRWKAIQMGMQTA